MTELEMLRKALGNEVKYMRRAAHLAGKEEDFERGFCRGIMVSADKIESLLQIYSTEEAAK